MSYCPYPRNYEAIQTRRGQQLTPPRARPPPPPLQGPILQQPPMVQPQIIRPPMAPQPVMEIPPLPSNNGGERAVNIIRLEDKGKEKMKEPVVMQIKKARFSGEATTS